MTPGDQGAKKTADHRFGVLLTRPQARAEETAKALKSLDIPVHCLPLSKPQLIIDELPSSIFETGQKADFIFTSPTAVQMFETLLKMQNIKLDREFNAAWCVGQKTAETATGAGFANVHAASGNISGLSELVSKNQQQLSDAIFYMAPRHKAGDLSGMLAENGIVIKTMEIYANELVDCGKQRLVDSLNRFETTCVFNYSKRTTAHFISILQKYGLVKCLENVDFISLSDNVASAVPQTLCERNWVVKDQQERFMIEMARQHMQSCCDT